MPELTQDELRSLVDRELEQSIGLHNSDLTEARKKALDYYMGKAVGDLAPPAIDGRSAVVSNEVLATVEWMLPQLLKVFAGGDAVVEFTPRNADDVQKAEQATDYCNYVLLQQNPGFHVIYTWIKDALLSKVGLTKVYWETSEAKSRESYKGLTVDQLTMLLAEREGAEIIEHNAYPAPGPQMAPAADAMMGIAQPELLYDVTLEVAEERSAVRVVNVPPEEFRISKQATSCDDAPFIAHVRQVSKGELKKTGYDAKLVDQIGHGENQEYGAEREARNKVLGLADGDEMQDATHDDATLVWVSECYLQLDGEWRKITKAGSIVLDDEEVEEQPFCSICPVPLPHQFFGLSLADLAMDPQRVKTSLLRSFLDNLYLSVNQRTFAVEGQVNLDDLLASRPGGVVRVKSPQAVGKLFDSDPGTGQAALQALEYIETQKENQTGFTRYSQGVSADSLNNTATGMNIITNRSDQRMELIARVFAETGFTALFRKILRLLIRHQDKAVVAQLRGQWVDIQPQEWRDQFDMSINVGLGAGNRDQQAQHMMALMQMQQQLFSMGLVQPQNVYNAAAEYVKAMGYKNTDKFLIDPSRQQQQQPPQPPPPDPRMLEAQAKQQEAQAKLQLEQQKHTDEMALRREQLASEYQLKLLELQLRYPGGIAGSTQPPANMPVPEVPQ
ncbi:hypothetical protein C8E02_0993 [Vogesella indigofera]|uniref:Phage portal protein n=1 Tax=Vogesella indigofera TaxID=45465 RepID=A0A495BJ07_VOGIN|nr:hypothetical protein [Vogesella indigofera]RKQ61226.1 hypothetical protein C8E02_0993 [Vogesella indigofera]